MHDNFELQDMVREWDEDPIDMDEEFDRLEKALDDRIKDEKEEEKLAKTEQK